MNDIEMYQPSTIKQALTPVDELSDRDEASGANLVRGILRRWYIILLCVILISAIGIPAIWLIVKPKYQATGYIHVAPIIPSILFSDRDSEGVIPMYQNFVNTQAEFIKSEQVIQRAADMLADKDMALFKGKKWFSKEIVQLDPVTTLRKALNNGTIEIRAINKTELIAVSMESESSKEAEWVVKAFLQAYMAVEGYKTTQGGDETLRVLEDKKKTYFDKLQRQQTEISSLAEEYGSAVLTGRHDIKLSRLADLQKQLTQLEAERLALEVKVQLLEQTSDQVILPEGIAERRHAFINEDSTVKAFTEKVAELEERLVIASQTLAKSNPELKRHEDLLRAFKERLEQRKAELGETFDKNIVMEAGTNRSSELKKAKVELEQKIAHEKILRDELKEVNQETIALGKKQLAIQELQEQEGLTKEMYDAVNRRIQELEVERKRPARISTDEYIAAKLLPNKRIKFSAAVVFVSFMIGMGLAFLRHKADNSVRTPDDIIRFIGVPVIGTTSSADDMENDESIEQVVSDYQNIRANLGLLSGGDMPKILVITSSEKSEGKTTFSTNLATSIARSGRKVLLIDGDLRKPDIGRLLHMTNGRCKLIDVLAGKLSFEKAVESAAQPGLHVLAADYQPAFDAVEVLTKKSTAELINELACHYDHIIIDSPPVLVVPDALLWAKLADAVVLCSLAGKTNGQALKEALARLDHLQVKVLGNVLSNVNVNSAYYRYGYGYYRHENSEYTKNAGKDKRFLIHSTQDINKSDS